MDIETLNQAKRRAFARYLRTGRHVLLDGLEDADLQTKFNPNHDPRNGQFTSGFGGAASSRQAVRPSDPRATRFSNSGQQRPLVRRRRLGRLSAMEESHGDTATISSGKRDPGGVSYGTYQLSSNAGMIDGFVRSEQFKKWKSEFGNLKPLTANFNNKWKEISKCDPEAFEDAQFSFLKNERYDRTVADVEKVTGLDLDARHDAVREATLSASIQHGGARSFLMQAVKKADLQMSRSDRRYDNALINAIYDARTDYGG